MIGESAARAIASMRAIRGTSVTLRRAGAADVTVIATIMQYKPNEILGGIQQGDRWAKFSDTALAAAGWPGPPRRGDVLMIDGRTFTAISCDTVKMGNVILSHTMQVRGNA